jgi:hypothetical protein
MPAVAQPAGCQWDTEILGHAFREWPGFTMHAIARRACGPGEFDLRAASDVRKPSITSTSCGATM